MSISHSERSEYNYVGFLKTIIDRGGRNGCCRTEFKILRNLNVGIITNLTAQQEPQPQDSSTWVSLPTPTVAFVLKCFLLSRYLTIIPPQALGNWCPTGPLPQEKKVRAWSSSGQHEARGQTCPHRPCPWWKPQISCSPSRGGQLCLGFRIYHSQDKNYWCRTSHRHPSAIRHFLLLFFRFTMLPTTNWSGRTHLSRAPSSRLMLPPSASGMNPM